MVYTAVLEAVLNWVRVRISPGAPNSNAGLRREVIRLLYTESDDSSSLSPGTKFILRMA